jgi:REP element-mobilizing transposase RayT
MLIGNERFMTTYTQILYHIVFGTKDHSGCLDLDHHDALCDYIAGLLKHKNCFPHKLGGYTDHVHILTALHPSISLADLVKDIKLASAAWIKQEKVFPSFSGWQVGYGAFTCSWSVKSEVQEYIFRQREHHRHQTFREEYIDFLKRAGVAFDESRIDGASNEE